MPLCVLQREVKANLEIQVRASMSNLEIQVRASISNLEIQVRASMSNLGIQVRVSIRKSPFTCEVKAPPLLHLWEIPLEFSLRCVRKLGLIISEV